MNINKQKNWYRLTIFKFKFNWDINLIWDKLNSLKQAKSKSITTNNSNQ